MRHNPERDALMRYHLARCGASFHLGARNVEEADAEMKGVARKSDSSLLHYKRGSHTNIEKLTMDGSSPTQSQVNQAVPSQVGDYSVYSANPICLRT